MNKLFKIFKKKLPVILSILAVFIVIGGLYAFSQSTAKDVASEQENVEYTDLYSKEIEIGNTKLNLEVKTATFVGEDGHQWLSGEYRFYSTDRKPKLLATAASLIPPEYKDGVDPFFFTKDITGDGLPELFVMRLSSASNLRLYEILTLKGDALVNITMRINGENDKEISFDDIARKEDRYIAMTWHGPSSAYEVGRNDYILLDDDSLMLIRSLSFVYGEDGESCDVKQMNVGDKESKTIAHEKKCGHTLDDFDKYLERDPSKMSAFEQDLEMALSDPKWSALASVYKKECDITGMLGSVMNANSLAFRPLMEASLMPVLTQTGAVYLFPCGMGSYETSYLVALDDHQGPTPIPLVKTDKNGGRHVEYQVVEFSYDRDRDTFETSHKPKQNASCLIKTEYKLTDSNELQVERITGDDNCDDAKFEDRIIYDINQQ